MLLTPVIPATYEVVEYVFLSVSFRATLTRPLCVYFWLSNTLDNSFKLLITVSPILILVASSLFISWILLSNIEDKFISKDWPKTVSTEIGLLAYFLPPTISSNELK